jgi:hypothetical protein
VTLTQRCTQDRVHKSAGARFTRRSRQIDGVVNDRRSRDASEVEELIQTQAEDCEYFTIQFRDTTPREVLNEVIEASLPAESPRDNLGGK